MKPGRLLSINSAYPFPQLFIDLSAMADSYDNDDKLPLPDFVDDPVV